MEQILSKKHVVDIALDLCPTLISLLNIILYEAEWPIKGVARQCGGKRSAQVKIKEITGQKDENLKNFLPQFFRCD
ncbi:CLUMA_CG003657, isoform A [Clunio marinus]|uniref:CLUMA_CG003657, isoform A n=1 Tax=Clunio marinus TaxID=568069 RepID=A0A1J1HTW6_9DIPT|nr:CLUMA_CG003657, isoform A [Clunio marinus]